LDLFKKEEHLINILKEMKQVVVALSGGVDSTYLAAIAYKTLGDNAKAITLHAEYVPLRELEETKKLTSLIGVKHQVIPINALSKKKITDNTPDRCFYCKSLLFSKLIETAKTYHINNIIDGSNTDDMKEYRPGIKALKNLGIRSPLIEAGLSKQEIRDLSQRMNLPTWNKSSFSCLATRIPYGSKITHKKLSQLDKAEEILFQLGLKQFRVRHHDEIARIEVNSEDFPTIIKHNEYLVLSLQKLGFQYISLDLQGFRSGSLNEKLIKAE